ncbi:probable serine/threonine-protein kinase DDB_G0282963 [Ceratitis capitata]|uniref:probable serine/threonine-protein kinase DDB_G0282963 n=1 Tax=Ceratitis capitata TaxID=7213 RepID=UPI0006188194|nr:probable serine/threonine-protein kinase DDB_G0282963 [Ceratitis capitata]
MDNSTPKNLNKPSPAFTNSTSVSPMAAAKNTSASYSSKSSSSDSKMSKAKLTRDQKISRGFLNCIGKHLGCSFLQQNPRQIPQQQLQHYIYNSQDDLPSSSTDSFSLSYERGSHTGFHLTGSSIDLTCSDLNDFTQQPKTTQKHHQQQFQHASRNTLSSSACSGSSYSPAFCSFDVDCLVDIYNGVDDDNDDDDDDEDGAADACASLKMYHCQEHNTSDNNVAHSCSSGNNTDTNSSDEDDECSTHEECCEQKQKRKNMKHESQQQQHDHQQKQNNASHRRLHLSRLSIASSVTRMLSHFASSSSMRSLSCSSTPLRCFKDAKPKEADDAIVHLNDRNENEANHSYNKHKKHSLPNTSSSSASSSSGSRSSSSGSSSSGSGSLGNAKNNNNNTHSSSVNGKKKEKKQQSILRPPVHYVYMKGMSGLYSRVPRYNVCSPYAMH